MVAVLVTLAVLSCASEEAPKRLVAQAILWPATDGKGVWQCDVLIHNISRNDMVDIPRFPGAYSESQVRREDPQTVVKVSHREGKAAKYPEEFVECVPNWTHVYRFPLSSIAEAEGKSLLVKLRFPFEVYLGTERYDCWIECLVDPRQPKPSTTPSKKLDHQAVLWPGPITDESVPIHSEKWWRCDVLVRNTKAETIEVPYHPTSVNESQVSADAPERRAGGVLHQDCGRTTHFEKLSCGQVWLFQCALYTVEEAAAKSRMLQVMFSLDVYRSGIKQDEEIRTCVSPYPSKPVSVIMQRHRRNEQRADLGAEKRVQN